MIYTLTDEATFFGLINRIDQIMETDQPAWGKMNASQMLHHLNRALGCGVGAYDFPDKSNILTSTFVKWVILYLLRSFPKNAKTPSPLKVVSHYEMEEERQELKEILERIAQLDDASATYSHPYFGTLTANEWNRLAVIHTHYHLKQFGR